MKPFGLTRRALIIALFFLSATLALVYAVRALLDRWTQEIVQTNTALTLETVKRISAASFSLIDSLEREHLFSTETLTKKELRKIDRRFSEITAQQAHTIVGMEGGFYLLTMDEMIGYSWPTAPEPTPAYGPAPRSYPIIKMQLLETIRQRRGLLEFHSFDFAVFPLATEPIMANGTIVGGTWARIHVERELPSSRLARVLNFAAIVSLGAFGAALILLWARHRHVKAIRTGLERLKLDPTERLPQDTGVYGAIASSINSMVDALMHEQQQREQLERELHQQDKMATLGKLIAGVAHEVKTPLAVIKTRIQMWQRDLHQEAPNSDLRKTISDDSMDLVVKEINRLSNLVKRLLVFAKPTQNKFQRHSINDVVRQTALMIQPDAESKSIAVVVNCSDELPLLEFDHQALEQVCLNLSVNAVEAMPDGGTLTITTSLNKSHAIIAFRDTGKGIAEELRRKIFDPFFTTKEHGVGLGLSISYEIVKAHGGRLEFLPGSEQGTTCIIWLPLSNDQRK